MRWPPPIRPVPLAFGVALLVGCADQGPSNLPPTAAFTAACDGLTCQLTDSSTDRDGVILARTWSFGDGATTTERNPVHTYAAPGGQFTVRLRVTDDDGDTTTAVKSVTVQRAPPAPDNSVYERETPHRVAGRHSRYVIRNDGTFELRAGTGPDTTIYTGGWSFACCWGGWAIDPGLALIFDFDNVVDASGICGEAYGVFLLDGHMGVSYCGELYRAGLEEGVYTTAPVPATPGPPPPRAGVIAFVREGAIYLANVDGGGLVQLTNGPGDFAPAWSPDGGRIAFTRSEGTTNGVYVMDADGGNVVRRAPGSDPTWSPDGARLAFICRSGFEQGICVVNAVDDGSAPVMRTREPGFVAYPAWSPDGLRIAFTSDWNMFDFWFDIWVVGADGSQRTALTPHTVAAPNPYEHFEPAWAPDGQRIAAVRCVWAFFFCSSSAITVMNADGSGTRVLVATSGFTSPTWSPDGQVIAYASANTIEWVSADGQQRGRILDNGQSPAWRP